MERVPLLSGSRVVVAPVEDDDVVLAIPPEPEQIVDTAAAVRDAFRFPLSGAPLEEVARGTRRVAILAEPPGRPFPASARDPRQEALAAAIDELERVGVAGERQTIVVAGGLGQRLGRRDLERLLPPRSARTFRGRVLVHDAEDTDLVPIADRPDRRARIHRELVESDLVLTVTAAESVVDGGPGALVSACDAATVRAVAGADSLVEAAGAVEWELALEIEAALGRLVPLVGVSLVLDHPRAGGLPRHGDDGGLLARMARRSDLRAVFSLLPGLLRRTVLERRGRHVGATAAFAGLPSVAHAEALVRGVERRGIALVRPVDTLVVGAPWFGPHLPAAPANPVTVSAATLGLALRLHRDAFPIASEGTLVILHPFARSFRDETQAPYGEMFEVVRRSRDPDELAAAESSAAGAARSLSAYRDGRACHPRLPYADWAGCAPALSRVGRVVVAGCRDANAARALGFVPTRSVASALEMAHGVAGGRARVGVLLGPPYPPLLVGA